MAKVQCIVMECLSYGSTTTEKESQKLTVGVPSGWHPGNLPRSPWLDRMNFKSLSYHHLLLR